MTAQATCLPTVGWALILPGKGWAAGGRLILWCWVFGARQPGRGGSDGLGGQGLSPSRSLRPGSHWSRAVSPQLCPPPSMEMTCSTTKRSQEAGRPEVRRASRKAAGFEEMEDLGPTPGPWSRVSGIPPSFSPEEAPNSSISAHGCKPGSSPLCSFPYRDAGATGGFPHPRTPWCPRGTASNSPKELIRIGSQGLSEGFVVPVSILAGFLPVLDSVGNRRVHRPERTPPSPSARSAFPLPLVSGGPPFRAIEECPWNIVFKDRAGGVGGRGRRPSLPHVP